VKLQGGAVLAQRLRTGAPTSETARDRRSVGMPVPARVFFEDDRVREPTRARHARSMTRPSGTRNQGPGATACARCHTALGGSPYRKNCVIKALSVWCCNWLNSISSVGLSNYFSALSIDCPESDS
jgi:hypothetical protein